MSKDKKRGDTGRDIFYYRKGKWRFTSVLVRRQFPLVLLVK